MRVGRKTRPVPRRLDGERQSVQLAGDAAASSPVATKSDRASRARSRKRVWASDAERVGPGACSPLIRRFRSR